MIKKIESNMNEFAAMIKNFLNNVDAEIKDYKLNISTKEGSMDIEFYIKANIKL